MAACHENDDNDVTAPHVYIKNETQCKMSIDF